MTKLRKFKVFELEIVNPSMSCHYCNHDFNILFLNSEHLDVRYSNSWVSASSQALGFSPSRILGDYLHSRIFAITNRILSLMHQSTSSCKLIFKEIQTPLKQTISVCQYPKISSDKLT